MTAGLTISLLDREYDLLDVEFCAASERFSATTRIYIGPEDLKNFADVVAGFPVNLRDKRQYEFGRRGRLYAGGYCGLNFVCADNKGHVAVDVDIVDDAGRFETGIAKFRFMFEAAGLDRFVKRLYDLDQENSGTATLPLVR
jgi:hypothetical protein